MRLLNQVRVVISSWQPAVVVGNYMYSKGDWHLKV